MAGPAGMIASASRRRIRASIQSCISMVAASWATPGVLRSRLRTATSSHRRASASSPRAWFARARPKPFRIAGGMPGVGRGGGFPEPQERLPVPAGPMAGQPRDVSRPGLCAPRPPPEQPGPPPAPGRRARLGRARRSGPAPRACRCRWTRHSPRARGRPAAPIALVVPGQQPEAGQVEGEFGRGVAFAPAVEVGRGQVPPPIPRPGESPRRTRVGGRPAGAGGTRGRRSGPAGQLAAIAAPGRPGQEVRRDAHRWPPRPPGRPPRRPTPRSHAAAPVGSAGRPGRGASSTSRGRGGPARTAAGRGPSG